MIKTIKLSHEKPITDVKYNSAGDLLFTSAKVKDGPINVWWAENGERIGTYDGHKGAIYSIDVTHDSSLLISGAADGHAKMWEVETGKEITNYQHLNGVRWVAFSQGDDKFLTVTDQSMNVAPEIFIYKVYKDRKDQMKNNQSVQNIKVPLKLHKVHQALWGFHNETVITANSDGTIRIFSTERGKELNVVQAHTDHIMSIQYDKYRGTFLTASKDGFGKLIDSRTFETIKKYSTGRPLNSGAISPLMDHVILGGGEEADEVTRSAASSNQFKVKFYHSIFCDELGSVVGHFGPINCLAFNPNGRSFASGGEDGFVRLHYFDQSYLSRTDEISNY
jgi:translation initiation factor 3 subunit I